jgi:hypothetical protein
MLGFRYMLGPRVCGLAAGARRIRTLGPTQRGAMFRDYVPTFGDQPLPLRWTDVIKGDRRFEFFRIGFLVWYRPRIRHPPLFPPALPPQQLRRPPFEGAGPASLPERYGAVDRSIKSGVPFGKGGLVFGLDPNSHAQPAADLTSHPKRAND